MNKKEMITRGVESLLSGPPKAKPSASPAPGTEARTSGVVKGLSSKPLRAATFKVTDEHLEKLKCISFYGKRQMQDLVAEAFEDFFAKYEKQHGEIKTR